MAGRRRLPRNQYRCSTCDGAHVHGSQRGRECGRTPAPRTSGNRSAAPRTPVHRTTWTTRQPASRRTPKPAPARTPRPPHTTAPKLDRRTARRRRAKTRLSQFRANLADDAVTYVFDEDGFYTRIADRTLDNLPLRYRIRPKGHGLCVCLGDLSDALEPGTYSKLAQTPIRDGLLRLRFPKFLADVLSSMAAFGIKDILGALPPAHLATTLKVLIPLVCPDLIVCPARTDVLKTYASPVLSDQVKDIAASVR